MTTPDAAGDLDSGNPDAASPATTPQDVLSTALAIDLEALQGTATIRVSPAGDGRIALAAAGLTVDGVRSAAGPVPFRIEAGSLLVDAEPGAPAELVVEYGFEQTLALDGYRRAGSTLLWPYHCGNLYPCNPDPAEGLTFELAITGVPDGQAAVFPDTIPADAPPYMIAWAVDRYVRMDVGTTPAGTAVVVWYLPGNEAAAAEGGAAILRAFDWYERTLGPYVFGDEVGAVPVDWGLGLYGGMEHHPYWHVSRVAMGDPVIQAHEAAHGWFGDGVRLRCWEDLVLSEGTATYLAARALEATDGAAVAAAVWDGYQGRLDRAVLAGGPQIAWPESCGVVDVLRDRLFGDIPYLKGAFFLRALERRVGVDAMDAAMRRFYEEQVGRAAGMQDLLDAAAAVAGYDPNECAEAWLRSVTVPSTDTCP